MDIPVIIHASNRATLVQLFHSEYPQNNILYNTDGFEVKYLNAFEKKGITSQEVLISLLISIGTGVPVGVISSWIYEKLCKKGAQSIEIGDDQTIKTSSTEIRTAIEIHISVNISSSKIDN